ncbi:MAG TPA: GNAT family N-acetyltransferase [Candidatus Limnocylindrales bacterium]|nr:GNAT family N-acetyltransferase [Candidatus Limnocylindrales bacterium]
MTAGVRYRTGTSDDLDVCTRVWKAGIEDYQSRLNQPSMPDDLGPLRRLLAHLLGTDPDRFWVAVDAAGDVVGFSAASVRDGLWFLAMLFVQPGIQARGIGQALMDHAQAGAPVVAGGPAVPGPDDALDSGIHTWGMCTDAVQPISNGLYARRGMIPRIPIWRLFGEVRRRQALPVLPASLEAVAFESVAATEPDGERRLQSILDELDGTVLGVTHAADHTYLRRDGRAGFLVRDRGDGRAHGYAYGSGIGRMGPILALDAALHPTLIGVAVRETPALGPVALWVPGTADVATRALLDAGLRLDGFPGLICWSRPEHPFDRYLPISLALV